MKTFCRMLALCGLLFTALLPGYSQCPKPPFSSGGGAAPTTGEVVVNLQGCNAGNTSFPITDIISGNTYVVTITDGFIPGVGAYQYATVFDGATVIAAGQSPLTFTATSSGTYDIGFTADGPPACTYPINCASFCSSGQIACVSCPPVNDLCTGAKEVVIGNNHYTNSLTATDDSDAPVCDGVSSPLSGIWYVYHAPANMSGTITLNGCFMNFDSRVRVYTGPCNALTCVTGDDSNECPSNAEVTSFPVASSPTGLDYYILISGGSGQVFFTASAALLPLELKFFSGQVQAATNLLHWETLSEKNVQFHVVERSVDGSRWTEVGRVAGKGDSQVSVKYALEDRTPLARAYYRLRSVDFDGKESRSASLLLTRKSESFGITGVYPSPTNGNVTVQFNATAEEKVTVRVMDMQGRLVLQQYTEAMEDINELAVTLTGLQAGVYSLTVSNSTEVSAPVRFMKQ